MRAEDTLIRHIAIAGLVAGVLTIAWATGLWSTGEVLP